MRYFIGAFKQLDDDWYQIDNGVSGDRKNEIEISEASIGDFIAHKFAFQTSEGQKRSGDFYTKIKAVGVVLEVKENKFKVKWLISDEFNIFNMKWYNIFFEEVRDEDDIEKIYGEGLNLLLRREYEKNISLLKSSKNLIFTGAPGTGKTYLAKQIAKAMGAESEFVQFHPSYDYTDFVEGLRPTKPDSEGNIGFELKDGVFKDFCKKAKNSRESIVDNFDEAYSKLVDYIVENDNKLTIKTKEQGKNLNLSVNSNNNLSRKSQNAQSDYSLTKENIYLTYQNKKAKYLENYNKAIIEKMKIMFGLKDYYRSDSKSGDCFVFIIDEINRAEISKVFGELFFSIDPSYRGVEGRVKTQYANLQEEGDIFADGFYIPDNVYIIGTMNDIDRSVESMDFAMRRRFAWQEIKASDNTKMWDGNIDEWKQEAGQRMQRLNDAIEKTDGLSSAYHIGPAYFLKLQETGGDFGKLWEHHLQGVIFEYLRGLPNVQELMKNLKAVYEKGGEDQIADETNNDRQ